MELEQLVKLIAEKHHTVCIVGAGGKTTLMYYLAEQLCIHDKKVLVTTSTHIRRPDHNYALDAAEAARLWAQETFAVIGENSGEEKLKSPSEELYAVLAAEADIVLVEADGSRGIPCKIPAAHEPVIRMDCDLVIAVMGMTSLGRKAGEGVFRFAQEGAWLGVAEDAEIDEMLAAKILCSEKGSRKNAGARPYIVVLNQCDNIGIRDRAVKIAGMLKAEKIDCICTSFERKCL